MCIDIHVCVFEHIPLLQWCTCDKGSMREFERQCVQACVFLRVRVKDFIFLSACVCVCLSVYVSDCLSVCVSESVCVSV